MKVDELKEWRLKYAGMAMQGLLSNVDMFHLAIKAGKEMNMSPKTVIARNALSYADELIKELAGDNIELSPVKTEGCMVSAEAKETLLEQKPAWSDENTKIVNNLISELTNLSVRGLIKKTTEEKYVDFLKSLPPQNHWKPSDKQLYDLSYAINHFRCDGLSAEGLKKLLEQLKEL